VGAAAIGSFPLLSGYVTKEMSVLGVQEGGLEVAYWLLKLAGVGTLLVVAFRLPWFTWFARRPDATATSTSPVPGPALMGRRVPVSMYVAMGALAVVNVAIGVAPGALYGILPFEVDYAPYRAYRVADALVLIVTAAAVFWLGRRWLAGRPVTLVDTDWFYRELPRPLIERLRTWHLPQPRIAAPALPVVPAWTASIWFGALVVLIGLAVALGVGAIT
jgi:multicomponent Na+:H+ antiporter subunit D